MSTFGSTENDEDPIPKEEFEALLKSREKATVQGVLLEMDILKQKMENCYEKLDRMTKLYMTLDQAFRQFQQQRAIELQAAVNFGPTVRDGTDDKSSD